jgi:hypothetical protein
MKSGVFVYEEPQLNHTFSLPQRDFSPLSTKLNTLGWFLPPFINTGSIEMRLRLQAMRGPFTQDDLEGLLTFLYSPEYVAAMVLHRYPKTPVVALYEKTIAEGAWAHFAGLHHVAAGGLMPVIEGIGKRLASERGIDTNRKSIKAIFEALLIDAKEDVVRRRIGATAEIIVMLDSFSCFIASYFYSSTDQYPLLDGTNRHGVAHGLYTDAEYGSPLNFFKIIAAVDFLTFISLLRPLNMSGLAPDPTPESMALAKLYAAADGSYATPSGPSSKTREVI